MAAGVEGQCILEVQRCDDVVRGCGGGERGESCVEVVDVGLVVLGMVECHDLS